MTIQSAEQAPLISDMLEPLHHMGMAAAWTSPSVIPFVRGLPISLCIASVRHSVMVDSVIHSQYSRQMS